MKLNRSFCLMASGLTAFAAAAGDYHWNWTDWAGEDTAWFTTAGYWEEGAAPYGDTTANLYLRSIAEPDWKDHDSGFYVPQALVLPSDYKTFNSIRSSMPGQYIRVNEAGSVVRVADPTGFEGLWFFFGNNNSGFAFENDGSFLPTVQYLANGFRVNFDTAGESTRAAVGSLTAPGLFVKKGLGELKLVKPAPLGSTCCLREGTLTLGRAPVEVPAAPAEGFIYHLDAMAEGTLTTEAGEDGFDHVTRWNQVENPDVQPMLSHDQWATPRLVTVNGRKMVDFGAHAKADHEYWLSGEDATLGPAAMLWTSPQIMPVREVFFVAEVTTDSNQMVAPFGGGGYYAWLLNSNIAGNLEYAGGQGDVTAGYWLQDGVCKRRGSYPTKKRVVVYSVQGWFAQDGDVARAFDCLAFSGPGVGSAGGIRLGEIVAYARELTEAERMATQRYLMNKWHDGSERQTWDADTVALLGDGAAVRVEDGQVAQVRHVFGSYGAGSDEARYTLTKRGAGELVIEDAYPHGTMPIRVEEGSLGFTATIARDAIDDSAPAPGAYLHLDATRADTLTVEDGKIVRWSDCAGRATFAAGQSGMDLPTVVDSGVGGMQSVDFGDFRDYGACLVLGDGETAAIYPWDAHVTEAFVVWKRNPPCYNESGVDNNSLAPLFSATGWQFVNFAGMVFSEDNAAPEIQGANLTVNGIHMWGHAGFDHITSERGFNVYNLSYGSQTMPINALARWVNNAAGGCQIAEYICYQRPLSDSERRNTVAYLMRKWGRGDHPDKAIPAVGPVTYAAGIAAPAIGTDSPRQVASVTIEGEARPLVKTGAGKLTVGTLSGVSALAVRAGAIAVTSAEVATELCSLTVPATQFAVGAEPLVQVGGTVTLAATGTLAVELPETAEYGTEYPLVSAGTLTGSVTGWTTTLTGPAKLQRGLRLFVRGDTLYAKLLKCGLVVNIR
ncbi:MAG: hypothetical protein ACI4RD_08095 [Kiritimatiellia bacterium]